MADYGSKVTEKALAQAEKKILKVFQQAADELQKKLDDFLRKHRRKGQEMLEKLAYGTITQAQYHQWMRGQVFTGKLWEQKVDQALKIMNDANRQAAEVVQKSRLEVFAENYNHTAYELEKKTGAAVTFNIFNTKSVTRLLTQKPKMLPEWKIDEPKDYQWNRQKVENCITQGIIQGEGIRDILKRLLDSLVTANRNRMKLFARTAVTGAQNAGRQETLEEAENDGIHVKKRWSATLDSRTRDTHQELDGQTVEVNEPFTVQVKGQTETIRYPGDPDALPSLVYNCRCALDNVVVGYENRPKRRAYREWTDENGKRHRESYIIDYMTYAEWKRMKEGK